MEMKWTPEQQKVIELRDRNILVSAAAGSGKTAVLVERILGKLTRKDHPIDIDQLLIVTFTRAAAGEMRERLTEAVENYLEQDPENEHLQRQQTLIHNAQITTIDGFCSYVIRNYFHTIDLDPGFRTANEGEIKLLKQDVAKEVLESSYQERTESFDRFVESFATGKSDEVLTELILRMYEFAMSNPWPLEWLDSCTKAYEIRTKEELVSCIWMKKTVGGCRTPAGSDHLSSGTVQRSDLQSRRTIYVRRSVGTGSFVSKRSGRGFRNTGF